MGGFQQVFCGHDATFASIPPTSVRASEQRSINWSGAWVRFVGFALANRPVADRIWVRFTDFGVASRGLPRLSGFVSSILASRSLPNWRMASFSQFASRTLFMSSWRVASFSQFVIPILFVPLWQMASFREFCE
jgi:hypothetical protein